MSEAMEAIHELNGVAVEAIAEIRTDLKGLKADQVKQRKERENLELNSVA